MLVLHVGARQKRKIPWGDLKVVTAGQVEQPGVLQYHQLLQFNQQKVDLGCMKNANLV